MPLERLAAPAFVRFVAMQTELAAQTRCAWYEECDIQGLSCSQCPERAKGLEIALGDAGLTLMLMLYDWCEGG